MACRWTDSPLFLICNAGSLVSNMEQNIRRRIRSKAKHMAAKSAVCMETPSVSITPTPDCTGRRAIALVTLITIVGTCVRAYRLPQISITFDEYITGVAFLEAPTLRMYLDLVLMTVSEQPVSYHVFQYFWHALWGADILAMRLLPLVFNIPAIPLVYLLTAKIASRRAGLTAALFLSLSPMAIFWSQGFRFYMFAIPIALLSMYTFFIALEHDRPGRFLGNTLINVLLISFQVTAVLLVVVEVIIASLFAISRRSKSPWLASWIIVSLFTVILAVFAFATKPQISASGVGALTLVDAFKWIFASDAIHLCADIPQPVRAGRMPDRGAICGTIITIALLSSFVWFVFQTSKIFVMKRYPNQEMRNTIPLFLLLAWILPVLILFAANSLWTQRLHFFPRYIMFSLPVIHAALSLSLFSIPSLLFRRALLTLLIIAYIGQIPDLSPLLLRADWINAARYIHDHAGTTDVAIVTGEPFSAEVFECNARWAEIPLALPIMAALTPDAALDATLCYLTNKKNKPNAYSSAVWLLIGARDSVAYPMMNNELKTLGLKYRLIPFVAGDIILLYKIVLDSSSTAPTIGDMNFESHNNHDEMVRKRWLSEMRIDLATEEGARAKNYLDRIAFHMFYDGMDLAISAFNAVATGNITLASRLADLAVSTAPKLGHANLAKAMALKLAGCDKEAHVALENAFRVNKYLEQAVGPEITRILGESHHAKPAEEIVVLKRLGLVYLSLPLARIAQVAQEQTASPMHCGVYAVRHRDAERILKYLAKPEFGACIGLNDRAQKRMSLIRELWFVEENDF